ncbi:polyketide cyclase [Flavipsychrobacter stenotrophus]|uniref:Polyketide cyclase n=1 Tax=Flavipsychrobacter stenotrophus TaxID=2077091 RepID=A0A2S7SXB5_9BACT|nr:SRPBCC family protein [Flavipsychrobacter stenotrophus]PQJ11572.1 polyketide cyclase [Flavipsychrobacter stenotrophus]
MKIVKMILLVLVAIIVIALIAAAFMKKDFNIEREVTINKSRQEVFDYIKVLKNQTHYSKWVMMDPNAKMEYRGTDGAVGSVSAWDSENKNVGKGEQEIMKLADGQKMDLEVRFKKPFESKADAYMTTEDAGPNQTKVKWGFHSKMAWPTNLFTAMMNMEKMVGDDLQTGLTNLKGVMEK